MKNLGSHEIADQPWPEDGLEYLGSCPVCGSGPRSMLYEGLQDTFLFCSPGSWTLHRCDKCSCAYLDPRPTPATIAKAYEHYYTHEDVAGGSHVSLWDRVKLAGKNGYLNRAWGTSFFPASRIIGMMLTPSLKALIDGQMMRHLPKPSEGRSLLDVGCGSGHFLSFAQGAGWRVAGIDLDPKAVEAARSRGLNVRLCDIGALAQESACFDAITVSHVIEHVYNPQELLNSCYRLLKSSGYFWIETPNVDSYGHSKFKGSWRGLEPPRHLQLLSWSQLKYMLDKAGFKQVTQAGWRPEYLTILYSSKAIKHGMAPGKIKPTCLDRINSCFVETSNRIDYTRREFITFKATK